VRQTLGQPEQLRQGYTMPIRAIMIVAALCCAAGSSAEANTEAAVCVAKLSDDGQLIFNTVRPDLVLSTDLRTLVRAKVIELVGAGKISQAAAPQAALAAAACLERLRK
jgi:hypothetical protein